MKIYFDTIGCRLNQAEIERWAAQFLSKGYEIAQTAESADLVVVNTCTVTAAAASDSRGKIRNAARSGAKVAVTGCWSTLEPKSAAAMDGVSWVIPNLEKDDLPAVVSGMAMEDFDTEPIRRVILPGIHARTRAFIKVQDGCDNHCTFCATHLARGKARSVPKERVLRDVLGAIAADGKEIVLTGVNLGAWGVDLEPAEELADLIEYLLNETDIPRIRLSSLESWNLSDRFLRLWENKRMCPHFHIPLQSGSKSVLHRMVRRTSPEEFRRLVLTAFEINPDFAVTSDVIAGFPGETDAEFMETLAFIQSLRFAGGHVFPYSKRPGTPAALLPNRIDRETKKQRAKVLRDEFEKQAYAFEDRFIGTEQTVLWESAQPLDTGQWEMHGLTPNYLTVSGVFDSSRRNELTKVTITGRKEHTHILTSEPCSEPQ